LLASLHVQIKRISVKEVTSPIIFDNLKNAVIGGLYDPAFGPMDPRETCRTCGLNSYECPGHFGHVEVSVPLYNPLVFMTLFKVLRTSCMHCFKFRMTDYEMGQFCERFELLRGGELVEAMVRCVVVRISQLVSRISYLASRTCVGVPLLGLTPSNDTWSGSMYLGLRLLLSLSRAHTPARAGESTRQGVRVKKLVSKRKSSLKAGEEDLEDMSSEEDALKKPSTPPRKEDSGTAAAAMTSQMMEAEIGTQRDFFKGMTAGRCPHCGAHSPVLKREGYTKLFLMPLPPKKRAANAAQGTVR